MSVAARKLARYVAANPFAHLSHEETRTLFGIGEKSFRDLLSMQGVPLVANKINPAHFHQWLWENRATLGHVKP